MKSHLALCQGLGISFCAVAMCSRVFSAELPAEVENALHRNAEALSPITIAWTQQYAARVSKSAALRELGEKRPANIFFSLESHRMVWQSGKLYLWAERPSYGADGRIIMTHDEMAMDGAILYRGSPDTSFGAMRTHPRLVKERIADAAAKRPTSSYSQNEYLESCGYRWPSDMAALAQPKLESIVHHLLARGASLRSVRETTVDGRGMVEVVLASDNPARLRAARVDLAQRERELRTTRADEATIKAELLALERMKTLPRYVLTTLRLESALNYAVAQHQNSYEDGTLLSRTECSDFHQVAGREVWLPHHSLAYIHANPLGKVFSKPPVTFEIRVSSIDAQAPALTRFVLNYTTPGTRVATIDNASGTAHTSISIVPADPDQLDRAAAVAKARAHSARLSASRTRRLWIATAVAAIVVLGSTLYVLRQRGD